MGLVPDEYEHQHDHNSWYNSATRERVEEKLLAEAKKASKGALCGSDFKGERVQNK
jgi:hypothetical protein